LFGQPQYCDERLFPSKQNISRDFFIWASCMEGGQKASLHNVLRKCTI